MTQIIVIGETEFEAARVAFVNAWREQDELLQRLGVDGVPGTRTAAGLRAALRAIGIGVDG